MTTVNKEALEALVVFYELWGFDLWYMSKIIIKSNHIEEVEFDTLTEAGYTEKQHIVLADEIAKAITAGATMEQTETTFSMSKAFVGDEWNQYRITQAGLDYWNSLGAATYLDNFLNEVEVEVENNHNK